MSLRKVLFTVPSKDGMIRLSLSPNTCLLDAPPFRENRFSVGLIFWYVARR